MFECPQCTFPPQRLHWSLGGEEGFFFLPHLQSRNGGVVWLLWLSLCVGLSVCRQRHLMAPSLHVLIPVYIFSFPGCFSAIDSNRRQPQNKKRQQQSCSNFHFIKSVFCFEPWLLLLFNATAWKVTVGNKTQQSEGLSEHFHVFGCCDMKWFSQTRAGLLLAAFWILQCSSTAHVCVLSRRLYH